MKNLENEIDPFTLAIEGQHIDFIVGQTVPEISIVMPTYNVFLEYFKESVKSVLKQTFANFELLIVDDGSTKTQGIEWIETIHGGYSYLYCYFLNYLKLSK